MKIRNSGLLLEEIEVQYLQILSPHDTEICRIVEAGPEPNPVYWDIEQLYENSLIHTADDVLEKYYRSESRMCYHRCFRVKYFIRNFFREANKKSSLKLTYSAFHGVGSKFARRLFAEYGIPSENIFYVKVNLRLLVYFYDADLGTR